MALPRLVLLGAISAAFNAQTDGIVGAAVLSTMCVFAVALVLNATRIIKPTQKLASAVIAGLGGLGLLYLFVFVLAIFDWGGLYSESFRTSRPDQRLVVADGAWTLGERDMARVQP